MTGRLIPRAQAEELLAEYTQRAEAALADAEAEARMATTPAAVALAVHRGGARLDALDAQFHAALDRIGLQ